MTPRPPKQPTDQSKPKRFVMKRWFLGVSGGVILVLALAAGYAFTYSARISPHTTIAGIAIGGLTRDAALQKLNAAEASYLAEPVTLTYATRSWEVKPSDLGTDLRFEDAVAEVWNGDKNSSWRHQMKQLFASLIQHRDFAVGFVPLTDAGKSYLDKNVLQSVEITYHETTVSFIPGRVQIVPGKVGERLKLNQFEGDLYKTFITSTKQFELQLEPFQPEVTVAQAEQAKTEATALLSGPWTASLGSSKSVTIDPTTLASWLKTQVRRNSAGNTLELALNEDVVKAAVADWAKQAEQKATNARLKVDNGTLAISEPGQDGISLNIDQTFANVQATLLAPTPAVTHSFTTILQVAHPDVRQDNLDALGIKQLIGTATTDFSGSPTGRKTNIGVGQRALDGILIKSGDTFSTVGHLVPIDGSNGYVPELVIKNNRTIPEDGGGLCQVSTTLFRSVLNAGLPIVERQNHAYRVGYYERGTGPGLDATIYDPSPDFKWKNDTGQPIYLQSSIKGTTITFDLYGTSDGRSSTISAPRILETYPVGPTIYSNTDTLPAGTQKIIEHPHEGAKTQVDYTVMRDGKQVYSRTFTSVYKQWPEQVLVGTGPAATPSPTPSPTPTP